MATTLLTTAPPVDAFDSGVSGAPEITSAGVNVDNALLAAVLAAATANGVTLIQGAGSGVPVLPSSTPRVNSVAGPPTSGIWGAGSLVIDSAGNIWTCKTGGQPGTWTGLLPQALNQRGIWAASTVYAIGDAVIAPTGDVVIPKVAFTSGVSYSAANWYILVPAAGFPGRKLGSAVLATGTGFTLSTIGPISGLTDTTKDVNTALLDVSVVIGSRPVMVEARVAAWFGTTGTYGFRLYDKTAGTIQDQDQRTGITAFQIVAPSTLKALLTPAAGIRNYGVKYNGTAGTNNMQISGASDDCQSWIQVTEL